EEGKSAQTECVGDLQALASNPHRVQVQEVVVEHHQRLVPRGARIAVAEDALEDPVVGQGATVAALLEVFDEGAHVLVELLQRRTSVRWSPLVRWWPAAAARTARTAAGPPWRLTALPDGGEPSSLMLSKAPGLVKRAIASSPTGPAAMTTGGRRGCCRRRVRPTGRVASFFRGTTPWMCRVGRRL